MSYCRWGLDGSDVYVIAAGDGDDDYWWCVGCEHDGAVARTPQDMTAHLLAHRERGDAVPGYAFERLERDGEGT